jgi:hypothetical protein
MIVVFTQPLSVAAAAAATAACGGALPAGWVHVPQCVISEA